MIVAMLFPDWAEDRLRAVSFFCLVLILSGWAVRAVWNRLATDFCGRKICYGRSLAVVAAWGLLCLVVLTMIAATRELMMPGSWQKVGLLYRAPPNTIPVAEPAADSDSSAQTPRGATGLRVGRAILLGWADFLRDRVSRVQPQPTAIAFGLGMIVLFVALTEGCGRWFCRTLSPPGGPPRRWRFRWSLTVLATLALMFATGYCAIGLARQIGWLLSA